MENEWFTKPEIAIIKGPLTDSVLKARAESGMIGPDTLVRKGAEGKWVPAKRVKGLFPAEADSPSPEPIASATLPGEPARQWFVTIEGEQKGPLTDAEIRRWVADGRVQPDTFVRQGANGEW